MKIKLMVVAMICVQIMYGSYMPPYPPGFAAEGGAGSSGFQYQVLPASPVPALKLPDIRVPAGGEELRIGGLKVKYPVLGGVSAPEHIQYSNTHAGHAFIEVPVLQQNCGEPWPGGPVSLGKLHGIDKIYTMAQLKAADAFRGLGGARRTSVRHHRSPAPAARSVHRVGAAATRGSRDRCRCPR